MRFFLQKTDNLLTAVDRFFTPRRILFLALGFASLWLILFSAFNVEIYRDMANCYAWYAREAGRGHWDALSIAALPPLNIFLGSLLVRCGMESYHALMLLGSLFFALTIFPLYGLLKDLLPEKNAAWGCFFFVVTPKLIRFSGMGLLEATRDFFLVSAVYLLFLFWKNRAKFYHSILLGLSLGLLALSRGEGIVMAGLIFLALFIRPVKEYRSFGKKILLSAITAAFSAVLILSPRLIETWKHTGYPVTDTRCIGLIRSLPLSSRLFQDKRPQESPRIDPAWHRKETPPKSPEHSHLCSNFIHLLNQMMRGGYEVYLIFAAIGIIGMFRKRVWRKEYSFLLLFSFAVSIIMSFYSTAYRYFVFLVPLLMVFTISGVLFLQTRLREYHLHSLFTMLLGAAVLVQTQNGWGHLFDQENGLAEIRMARFLKQNREKFLPLGERNRKLIIADHCLPEITFRADEARMFEYSGRHDSPTLLKGFDVFIIAKEENELCSLMLARKDLREVQHPQSDQILLLTPVREETGK